MRLVTLRTAAELTGVAAGTLEYWIKSGRVLVTDAVAGRPGRARCRLLRLADVRRVMAEPKRPKGPKRGTVRRPVACRPKAVPRGVFAAGAEPACPIAAVAACRTLLTPADVAELARRRARAA